MVLRAGAPGALFPAAALALLAAASHAAPEIVREEGEGWSAELRFAAGAARYPALDALLRDTAAAALDDFAADAAVSAEADRPWSLWIEDETTFATDAWASVVRVIGFDTGGAHPNYAVSALIWDARAGAPAGLDRFVDLAAAGPALTAHLRAEIARTVHGGAADEFWREDIEAATAPEALEALSLIPSTEPGRAAGVVAHFSPYDVGPYAAGAPAIALDWRLFDGALTPDGAALFGGEPVRP